MKKIRVLVNFDDWNDSYKKYLESERFELDSRHITIIGTDNSADSLTEYDAIVLNYKEPMAFIGDRVEQILNFLSQEHKLFVFILQKHIINRTKGISNTIYLQALIDKLGGAGIKFIYEVASGSNFTVLDRAKSSIFYDYLMTNERNWKISFRDLNYDFIKPLAINSDNNIVSFMINNESLVADNAFIPWLDHGEKKLWDIIAKYLTESKQDYKDVADWVSSYTFKNLEELNYRISEKKQSMVELEEQKVALENQKKKYERIRNVLLYCDGDLLTKVCKEVFIELGINANDGKQGREDLVFVYDNQHFLIEVKGCEKSANKGHVKQVDGHKTEYKHDNEVNVKGILLINAWRKLPLEDRNTNEKPIFPNEIMNLVTLSDITLITTQQLFVAYCESLEGIFNLKSFVENIKNTKGVFEGYNNIVDYKNLPQ